MSMYKNGQKVLTTEEKADVNAEADTALTDYDPPTDTEMDTGHTNLTIEVDANETKLDTAIAHIEAGGDIHDVLYADAAGASIAVDIAANQTDLNSIIANKVSFMDFWSATDDVIDLPAVAADTAFPSVTIVGIPAGATWLRVIAMLKIRMLENTNAGGANALVGAQDIQVKETAAGTFTDAINLVDNQWTVAASTREGGDVVLGNIDVKAEVDGNDTYDFQLDEAVVDLANLRLNGVQTGLRVYFY